MKVPLLSVFIHPMEMGMRCESKDTTGTSSMISPDPSD